MHLDGYDQRALLSGEGEGKRNEFVYILDSGDLAAVRFKDWKAHFAFPGDWLYGGPPQPLTFPRIVNLRMDPLENHVHFNESPMAMRWMADKFAAFVPMQVIVGKFLETFKEFPQRQKSASFDIEQVAWSTWRRAWEPANCRGSPGRRGGRARAVRLRPATRKRAGGRHEEQSIAHHPGAGGDQRVRPVLCPRPGPRPRRTRRSPPRRSRK